MVYRLPGLFGKWCRPNYNSVVAAHNIVQDLPIQIHDPATMLRLCYIDVVTEFLAAMGGNESRTISGLSGTQSAQRDLVGRFWPIS